MSFSKIIVIFSFIGAAACSTTPNMTESDYVTLPQSPLMRHELREMTSYDSYKMIRLINRELNLRERNEDAFLRNVASVLSQTVLVQPHFPEREVALRELKGKLDQEDYLVVLDQAATDLLYFAKSSAPADQATALIALKNLVEEAKTMARPELNPVLQRIAEAHLKISPEAKKYADEPMEQLISPSSIAQLALQTEIK